MEKPSRIRPLRTVGLWGAAFLLTPSMALVAGASAFAGKGRTANKPIWWAATRAWAGGVMRSAGMTDLIVRGVEQLYDGQPYILMANHQSHLDPPSIILSSERPIGFLAKHELKRVPVFGWAMERTGHVFVDRKHKDKAHASIDTAALRVAEGRCVLVFPEGTRSPDGELLPFKKGGFVLAMKAGVPIVPVGIAGTREIFPSHNNYVRGTGPVAVIFGEPIASDAAGDSKEALMERARDAITVLRDQARDEVALHHER